MATHQISVPYNNTKSGRKFRNFVMLWSVLTFITGMLVFAGLYIGTGEIGSAGAAEVVSENVGEGNPDENASQSATAEALELAQQATATAVSLIGPPPSATPDPAAATATPNATPTIVPTINPPELQGTLPNDGSFELGGLVSSYDTNVMEPAWNYMQIAGMTWIKFQLRYTPEMVADDMGWVIQYNHENGFKVLFTVVGEPSELYTPGYQEEYAAYMARLAEIGADAVQVWNEVNLDREWPVGRISGAEYTNFLRVVYEAVKAANPNTLVISSGLAPTGFFAGCTANGCDDNVFYQQMAAAGAADYMDCVGAHYNEGVVSPVSVANDPNEPRNPYPTQYLQPNTDRAWAPFGGAVPVCYTELGYASPEGVDPLPENFWWAQNISVAEQASWLATAALINAESGKVRMMIIWNMNYQNSGEFDPLAAYAIIRPDGSCPACDSLGSIQPR